MSLPPRQPIGMPPMVPGMMTQGYTTFPTMGMVSVSPMGLIPPVIRPIVTTSSTATPTITPNKPKKQEKQVNDNNKKKEKPPVTTVFVGNISDRAPDTMIGLMLQKCGDVLSWKRVQGASGKMQAFGFCEYEDPEATLRCIRLLNDFEIADKKLVVKVDAKTKTLLDDYEKKKKDAKNEEKNGEKEGKSEGDDGEESTEAANDNDLDEVTKREDRLTKAGLDAIIREFADDLAKEPPVEKEKDAKGMHRKNREEKIQADKGLDDMELEEDTKNIINREIKSFRDLHKDEEVNDKENRNRESLSQASSRRRHDEARARKDKVHKGKVFQRERSLSRSSSRSRSRSKSRSRSRRDKSRERSREKSRDRSRERSKERDRRARGRDFEEEEEALERRKMEKKFREKEAAYQERLKNWMVREKKRQREYEKEKERELARKAEEAKEARRLKEFLEDYDDLRDDPKFYKGSALARRLSEREVEKQLDARDRQKEKEELEEIRLRLLQAGNEDAEAEIAKMEQERDEHLKPRLHLLPASPSPVKKPRTPPLPSPRTEDNELTDQSQISPPKMQPTLKPVEIVPSIANNSRSPTGTMERNLHKNSDNNAEANVGPNLKDEPAKIGFSSIKLGSSSDSPSESTSFKKKKITVGDVFSQDDDGAEPVKKRKLVPLDYDEEKPEKKATTAEEKRQLIKKLIEQIPTGKEELFSYHLDWNTVDQTLMNKRIRPWVNKKIVDYIGEEEPTLTDFICQKVIGRSSPQSILNDVAMVLDEEAEVFVVKMWRLLIYETEAKKAGLVK
ncbi:RBM25 [Acanthosepion pharaonis]|uniref:RBM25 n=1 Tax=Acanthosepion pharaonis TaxID=158019 RepID=A0A812C7V8_ACAPH|nr:RBM25 [Sepia pharaonis]